MTCTGEGTAEFGQYANVGTVTALDRCSVELTDADPSHYFGSASPDGHREVHQRRGRRPGAGSVVPVGDPVAWTYAVTNTGNVPLTDVRGG